MSPSDVRKQRLQGFVYSADEDADLFKDAKVGDLIIKQDRTPPFIVVDHSVDNIIITRWPGRLYKVKVINQPGETDINEGLVEKIWYTRTLGVKIVEELPVAYIFGENGQQICQIIDLARNITEEQVNSLSKYDLKSGRNLVTKAWRSWLRLAADDYGYLNDDHYDTLRISNIDSGSPIKQGLIVIAREFDRRATELVGSAAFDVDEEGETYLRPKWAKAEEKLRQAAISYESDNLLSQLEKDNLRKPVVEVFGLT